MKRKPVRLLLALLIVVIAIQLVPIRRTNPVSDPAAELQAPVSAIFRRACYDCHSNRTVWPWYSRIAPVSWMLAYHAGEGRKHVNLSVWTQYPAAKQRQLAGEIVDEVDGGGMPLPMYVWIHRAAKLSPADREQIHAWAGALTASPPPGSSPQP
jgi:hypothetical protein